MKNSFFITACRFHTKEKNKLLIIGYFRNNQMEEDRPIICLDKLELPYEAEEIQLTPMRFREVDDKLITKQYFLYVMLPKSWETYEELKIFNSYETGTEYLTSIKTNQLIEWQKSIPKSVDIVIENDDGFRVNGWYIDTGDSTLDIYDMKGEALPVEITTVKRTDVLREYPENEENEVVGFSAVYKGGKYKKVKICFSDGERKSTEIVKISPSRVENSTQKVKELSVKVRNYYHQFGLKGVLLRISEKLTGNECATYNEWVKRHELSKRILREQSRETFKYMPKISVVVPLYKTPEKYLRAMIESVRKQSYENWELCLSDGSGEQSPIEAFLKEYEKKDSRIRVIYNHKQLHISDNTNEALKICTGDYIAFLDHDDLLTPDALYECIRVINKEPDTELIYSDEDKVDMKGKEYFSPHFKPDFNIDMLRSVNYFCHLVLVKRELYLRVGMLNSVYDGAQDYDFVLRCVENTTKIKHIPKVLYHWRSCEGSTAEGADNKAYFVKAGAEAIKAHYERIGIKAEVIPLEYAGTYRTKYDLKQEPLVSVIIPNKDHTDDLDKCMRSMEEKNSYSNIEYIIVENNSTEAKTFVYYEELKKRNPKVKVVYWEGKGFNYPAINTYGVKHAQGEYLLFLNNDTEIINSDCVEELLGYCTREDVGAVGARLYYEDGTIQHAGVIVGLGGVAGHAFLGFPGDAPGYFVRARIAQNLSAVTAACAMVKRSVYEEVGGFDEEYAVAFNDVDLCLKIRKNGYLIVYNPFAELMHYESKSRGYEDTEEKIARFQKEILLFRSRWQQFLENGDPYYNPNLTLDRNDFSLNMTVNKRK